MKQAAQSRLLILAAALLFPLSAQKADPVLVKSVRHWSQNGVTRVAIETSGEAKYRVERLEKPERLVVDLPDARLALSDKGAHAVNVDDRLVNRVRLAMNQPTVARVVLDLTMPVSYEISQLSNPTRLIVEVRPAGEKKAAPPAPVKPAEITKAEPAKTPAPPPVAASPPVMTPVPAPAPVEVAESPTATGPQPKDELPTGRPSTDAPKPAKPLSSGKSSLTRTLGLKLGKVVIDAGHGGHDQGTAGPTGLLEKDLVLDVALRLGALLEQRLGATVIYTRATDVFLPLEERTALANSAKADLFLSIHANASPYKGISGSDTYFLNFSRTKADLDIASRENAGTNKSIFELKELIQKIALREKTDESREFATKLQDSLASTWSRMNDSSRNRGVKTAPFVVLIGASMPSVLAEIGFISNPRDEAMLKKADQRQRIAEALFKGISAYAGSLSQTEVALRGKD